MRRLALCFAVASALATVMAPPRAQADGPPGVIGYRHAVHLLRISLERVASTPAAHRINVLPFQRTLLSLASVRLPDGRILATSTPQLAVELAPGDLRAVRRLLVQLRGLDIALAAQRIHSADHRQPHILDDVLRDRRFQTSESIWNLLRDWADNLLGGIFGTLANGGGVSAVTVAAGIVCLGLIAGIAFLLARGALESIVVDVSNEPRQEPTRADAAGARAADREAAGDYRTALRYLFLATLLSLQERAILELQPGLTNREYLRLVASRRQESSALGDTAVGALQELTDAFDRAWYGLVPVDARDYARYRALAQQVHDALGHSVAA